MTSPERYFFDIPVYRLPEERYCQEMECYLDGVLFPPDDLRSPSQRERDAVYPNENISIRDHLRKNTAAGGSLTK